MDDRKKRIALSLRIIESKDYYEKRDALSHDWPFILEKLNFIPIYVPNNLLDLKAFLKELKIDGIILSGGDNMGDNSERDHTENELIDFGLSSQIPIFGVCRGMQVLNKRFGGFHTESNGKKHLAKNHPVTLIEPFSSLLGNNTINVNSYHRNTIHENSLGNDLKPFAKFEDDNSVEGFYHIDLPIMGVMWHPERDPNTKNKLILKKIFQNKKFWMD